MPRPPRFLPENSGLFWQASELLREGRKPEAIRLFQTTAIRPRSPLSAILRRGVPPSPPTRRLEVLESRIVDRGAIPVVALPGRIWSVSPGVEPRARGQPP